MRLAQRDQCFQQISFLDVFEVDDDKSDLSIALAAINTLTNDHKKNDLDHILLARAGSIPRAEQIYELYKEHASEYNSVLVHSKLRAETKRLAIQQVRKGESRVVVCVDMFGEGFDLPQLKIVAMHDLHKSLAVTLQFIGRFTRTTPNIGEATMVANSVSAEFSNALRDLYAEDVDWNVVLRNLSEGATENQQKQSEFLSGFTTLPENFPVQTILPKMSTVVYSDCHVWQPDKVVDHIAESRIYVEPTMHPKHKVLLFVTKDIEPLAWAKYKDLHNTVFNLYLLHWDAERKLLFINSSEKGSFHEELAKAVGGDKARRIKGEDVFRALHGINRILFMNVGVNSVLGKALSHTNYTGADVQSVVSPAQLQNKLKSNLFGRGYEQGQATSMGCSYRGRLWSHRIADNIESWTEWCHAVATKLLDASIKYEDIFKHVLVWEAVTDRPDCVPLAVDWPSEFWEYNEDGLYLDVDGDLAPFGDVSLEILDPAKVGPLKFRICTEKKHVDYRVDFADNEVSYVPIGGREVALKSRNKEQDIGRRFRDESPKFYFENGGILDGTRWVVPQQQQQGGFPREYIRDDWDWTGIDIKKESQLKHDPMKLDKRKDSIQYRVIETLCAPTHPIQYDVIFDDDDAGESADVVGLKVDGEKLLVHLFHCKYSGGPTPGARMGDLYVVCGQAQTSTEWKNTKRVEKLLEHLLGRETRRRQSTQNKATRFEKGNVRKLHEMKRMLSRLTPEFEIIIVQPGLSKKDASRDQLDLLAVTDIYLRETSLIPLEVVDSP